MVTSVKVSKIRHKLHSLKKCNLSITKYVARIQNTCALLDASGSRVSEAKKFEVILASLPPEFDAMITLESFSAEPLPFQHLLDVFLEYEN